MDWRWRTLGVVLVVVAAMVAGRIEMVEGVIRRPVYEQFDGDLGSKGVIGLHEVRLGMGSILQALLDSQYSELVLYLDKVDMLEELELEVVERGAITVFAAKNSYLEHQLDPELRRFLMKPGHEDALRTVLRYHVVPGRVEGADFTNKTASTLSPGETLSLQSYGLKRYVNTARVFSPNSIVRKDGIVHGLDGFMIPREVESAFEDWKTEIIARSKPRRSSTKPKRNTSSKITRHKYLERAPTVVVQPRSRAVAPPVSAPSSPGPSLGPSIAPAPGPGTADFNWDYEEETLQFVTALASYGGYNDMAELLVNATTLGMELGKMAHLGYKLTILAPNDQAMQMLTMEQLNSPLEPLLYYHFLSEYQTEESMYNAVKRLGKQAYSTLRHPHKVVASESDGTVKFGEGEDAAHIFDHDIYVDGHISVQGITRVLSPPP